jgi:hypothetical protein
MTMCRPLAVVVGCLFLKPHFGHLPVSHRHPETTCFATVSCEHEIQTIMFVVFMGKALLKTFCDALRKQRLERQKVQVQLVTGDFE